MANNTLNVPPKLNDLECEHGFFSKDGKKEWVSFGSDTGKTSVPFHNP